MMHEKWMRHAVEQARAGIGAGQTPFGAVVVRGADLVAGGHNEVWSRCDPTDHAEMVAIRRAAAELRSINLAGCCLYTTCEPCPMCAAAIHWAKIDTVYYGATITDAARAGFTEIILSASELYRQGGSPVQVVAGILTSECAALFDEWLARPERRVY